MFQLQIAFQQNLKEYWISICIDMQVDLVGSAVVRLASHAEEYYMQLPGIVLDSPLSAACRPNLTGTPNWSKPETLAKSSVYSYGSLCESDISWYGEGMFKMRAFCYVRWVEVSLIKYVTCLLSNGHFWVAHHFLQYDIVSLSIIPLSTNADVSFRAGATDNKAFQSLCPKI